MVKLAAGAGAAAVVLYLVYRKMCKSGCCGGGEGASGCINQKVCKDKDKVADMVDVGDIKEGSGVAIQQLSGGDRLPAPTAALTGAVPMASTVFSSQFLASGDGGEGGGQGTDVPDREEAGEGGSTERRAGVMELEVQRRRHAKAGLNNLAGPASSATPLPSFARAARLFNLTLLHTTSQKHCSDVCLFAPCMLLLLLLMLLLLSLLLLLLFLLGT